VDRGAFADEMGSRFDQIDGWGISRGWARL